MKKYGLVSVVLILCVTTLLPAQERWDETPRVGIAVEDRSSASLVNMASVGVGNATGLGWSGYLDGSGDIDQTVHFALGTFAYNYRDFGNKANHELGFGFPLYQGLYFGTSLRWDKNDKVGWNTHLLYRPSTWLSFGIKGESLNRNVWMDWGVGVRPLAFNNFWSSRLTLFYDARVTSSGRWANLSTGFRTEPLDGFEVNGHWDFRDEKWVTGLNLSWNRFLLGGDATMAGNAAWEEGNIQAFASFKEMRSLGGNRRMLVVYDVAEVITDTPRLYADAVDLRPDPVPVRSLYEFIRDMEILLKDPEVESVLFSNQALLTSFSNILEIEDVLLRLKAAGTKIYFYADRIGSRQYALAASVADAVIMSPMGSVDLTGFGVTNLYLKDLMARYGISVENFRSHEYKSAYDQFSESRMSDAQRESLEVVYGALQAELDRMISEGRAGKLTDDLDSLYSEGFWMSARRAAEAGLVDELLYRDQLEVWLGMRRYQVVNYSRFRWSMDYDWTPANKPNLAIIYAKGGIIEGQGFQGASIGSYSLAAAIRSARRNPTVAAIVLRVDSGGGSALASDVIAREVALAASGPRPKPVVVSMGAMAASGGYMIAAPGSRILATPGTITGSIGVIALVPDISGLLEMFEVEAETIVTTESADVPNITRPLTEAEKDLIRRSIMDNYDSFVDMVAMNRNMTTEAVDAVAQGRIWSGKQAVENGLVDGIGGLSDAIALASDMANVRNPRILEIDPGMSAVLVPGIPGGIQAFLGWEKPDPLEALPDDLKDVVEFYRLIDEYQRGEALYLMPYTREELGIEDSKGR